MSLVDSRTALSHAPPRAGSLREVWDLAYPVALTQLSATLMGVTDSAMVGRLGAVELAAVGFASIWLWTVFSLLYGTASGVQTFVSQLDGAGEPERCGYWAWQGLWAVLPTALLASACLLPAVPALLALLGPARDLQAAAGAYAVVRLPGEPGLALLMVVTSYFRGIGDTRTPLYVTLGINALNAALDYGLIFGHLGLPAWGVAGAAAATAASSWTGGVLLLALFLSPWHRARHHTGPVAPRARAVRRFLRTSAPVGGQWFLGMTSFAVFTTIVARMGNHSMAASQAFIMLLSLSFMQAMGISTAAQTLVGRYKGAENPAAVRRSFASSLALSGAVAAGVAALFVAIPGPLLHIFSDDPGVVALGRPLLFIGALFQLCDAVAIVTQGALRGAGDTRWPFAVETAFGWGVFVPLAYFLGVSLELGLTGAWTGGLVSLGLSSSVLVARFRSGAWERIRI